jgi:hypothetical protein
MKKVNIAHAIYMKRKSAFCQEIEKRPAASLSPCFRGQLRPGAEGSYLALARVFRHVKV